MCYCSLSFLLVLTTALLVVISPNFQMRKLRPRKVEMTSPRRNSSNVESQDILLTFYLKFIPLPLVGADDHLKMWILRSVEVKYIVTSYSILGYLTWDYL